MKINDYDRCTVLFQMWNFMVDTHLENVHDKL